MYASRMFTDEELVLSRQIHDKFVEIEKLLDAVPNGREKSIVLSHIEDAMLHANLAIAESTPNYSE